MYSTNVQNEDNKQTVRRSVDFEIGEEHIAAEQIQRLIHNILVLRYCSDQQSRTRTIRGLYGRAAERCAEGKQCAATAYGARLVIL